MQASVHSCYVLACTGPYLSQIGMAQRDQSIYGIRRSSQTSLSTYFTPSIETSMHAPYVLACTGPYLSQFGSDQKDRDIYGIVGTFGL